MATTTTNYGFDVPTSSDLVKNGATQIALLGQDLDTFLFRPFTCNGAINGAFDWWQRGTSAAIPATYTGYLADRWLAYRAVAGATQSRQASGLTGFNYAARIQRDSGNAATNNINFYNTFETISSLPFAGQTVTASFYARAGANFSAASNGLAFGVVTGTGTDQNPLSGFTGAAVALSGTATLTTSWQRFSFTGTIGSSITQLAPFLQHVPTGTAGANDYFEVTGFQFEVGSQVSPFTRAGGTLQGELAACQRYYFRFTGGTNGVLIPYAYAGTSTFANGQLQFPVPMRVAPTVLDTATLQFVNYAGSAFAMSSVAFNETTATATQVYGTIAGATAGHAGKVSGSGATSFVGLSAEL
jgi:hypothetical protein